MDIAVIHYHQLYDVTNYSGVASVSNTAIRHCETSQGTG